MKREAVCTQWHHHIYEDVSRGEDVTCPTCNETFTLNTRNNNLLHGWRVVRDYGYNPEIDKPEWNRQGKEYGDYQGGKHRYRLKDDDGNTCYIIESDTEPTSASQSRLFAPLNWAANDVGATSIEYKNAEGRYEYL